MALPSLLGFSKFLSCREHSLVLRRNRDDTFFHQTQASFTKWQRQCFGEIQQCFTARMVASSFNVMSRHVKSCHGVVDGLRKRATCEFQMTPVFAFSNANCLLKGGYFEDNTPTHILKQFRPIFPGDAHWVAELNFLSEANDTTILHPDIFLVIVDSVSCILQPSGSMLTLLCSAPRVQSSDHFPSQATVLRRSPPRGYEAAYRAHC